MRFNKLIIEVACICSLSVACSTASAPELADLVVHNVTIIDGSGALPFRGTVVVDDGVIRDVRRAPAPDSAAITAVDGSGLFLVPGLWDMHVHLAEDQRYPGALEKLLRHGVTSVRDAGGRVSVLRQWDEEIERGDRQGPRIVVAGPTINGPGDDSYHVEVTDDASARDAVVRLAEEGVDAIKVHRLISPSLLEVIIDTAHQRELPVFGHIPLGMDPLSACRSGMDGVEHIGSFLESIVALSPDEMDLTKAVRLLSSSESDELVACLRSNSVAVTPTLIIYRYLAGNDPGARAMSERLIEALLPFVGRLYEAGVPLLAGTDAPLGEAGIPWGAALIEELEILSKAGIPPLEILRLSTSGAATEAGMGDAVGTIRQGFAADMILLRSDPMEDIANLREIEMVIARGKPDVK